MNAKKQQRDPNHACDDPDCSHSVSPRGINTDLLKVTTPSRDAPTAPDLTDQIVFVNKVADLSKVLEDNVHLAVWRQSNVPKFVTTLSDPSVEPENLPVFEGLVLPGIVAEVMKEHLSPPRYTLRSHQNKPQCVLDEGGIDELVQHVERQVEVFADILQEAGFLSDVDGERLPFVYVKLQAIEDDGCRFWHQDSVPFRMVTTYRGPCTEWVPPSSSKETLGQRQFDSEHARSLSHCDVGLFKGRGDADVDLLYDQPGIVHRSPRTKGSGICRLVLVLDIPQEWHFDE